MRGLWKCQDNNVFSSLGLPDSTADDVRQNEPIWCGLDVFFYQVLCGHPVSGDRSSILPGEGDMPWGKMSLG